MSDKNRLLITRRGAIESSLAFGLLSSVSARAAMAPNISATINAGKAGHPISDLMFGGFLEHGGNLINYSLWSEVLDDRKFFHAVDSKPLPAPPAGRRRPMSAMMMSRKWVPVGPDESVTMDTAAPYVGEHSPVVHLAGTSPRGIAQDGLPLDKKGYTGRIY